MKIVVLTENTVYRQGILAEHGLSLYIEENEKRYLFDTGQSGVFLQNAKKQGIDLSSLNGIILSHGHYDHCGGLAEYAREFPLPAVYVREEAFEKKYHRKKDQCREIGIPWERELILEHAVFTRECQQIDENMFVLGKIPAKNEFETAAEGMLVERDGEWQNDPFADEQMLIVRSEEGLNIFLGCAHVGVINALSYVREQFPGEHIHSLLAGMHLSGAGQERLQKTIDALEAYEIDLLMPLHCTGIPAIMAMKQHFGDGCKILHAGSKIASIETRRTGIKNQVY